MSTSPEVQTKPPRRFRWGCAGALVVVVAGGFLLWQLSVPAREAARRAGCVGTFKFFGVAMLNYHDLYGCFPPAYFADEDGRPMHSWRVFILPERMGDGRSQLYDEYDFDRPWDDLANLELARNVPNGMVSGCSTYRCPSESGSDPMHATYLMAVGPRAFSDGPHGRSIAEITDGTSCTLVLAEQSHSGIHWMEPRDLEVERMDYTINDPNGYGIRSPHPGVANALFGDGAVHSIREGIDPRVLRAVITADARDPGMDFHVENDRD